MNTLRFVSLPALALWACLMLAACARAGENAVALPPPVVDEHPSGTTTRTAVLAAGCFWGVQGVFQHVDGVLQAVSGYAGGDQAQARYPIVGTGRTAHAESVRISYDPSKISYGRLLQIYFSVAHDPTQVNRQGPDFGPQYRSTIFPVNAEQHAIAAKYIAQLDAAKLYPKKIATTVEDGRSFFAAEPYHQDFLARNPRHPYVVANDLPKVANLKKLFADVYRDQPVLVTPRAAGEPGR